jgi:hypothetical protein
MFFYIPSGYNKIGGIAIKNLTASVALVPIRQLFFIMQPIIARNTEEMTV